MRPTMIRRALCTLALVAASGCDATEAPVDAARLTGVYTLRTIYGAPLPGVVLQSGSSKTEIAAEQMSFTGDSTFADAITYRLTNGTAVTTRSETSGGTYSASGSTLELHFRDATGTVILTFAGTWSESALTLAIPGQERVFQK